jgi:hypothetical protein
MKSFRTWLSKKGWIKLCPIKSGSKYYCPVCLEEVDLEQKECNCGAVLRGPIIISE